MSEEPMVGEVIANPPRQVEKKEKHYCGARKKQCRNRDCLHHFTKDEYDLATCPECGEPRFCRNLVPEEGMRCRYHGGASLKGIASATWKHGRRSKYLPDRMVPRYQEAVNDPKLMSLRDDLALLESRMADLLTRVDTGEAGRFWQELWETWRRYKRWEKLEDEREMEMALFDLGMVIEDGRTDTAAWQEISELLEQRRKIIDSHQRQLTALHQFVTVERLMTLMGGIQGAIKEHVEDQATKRALGDAVRRLVSPTTR